MLILPIDDRPDWRRPPLLCLMLILINVLVFAWSHAHDQRVESELLQELDTGLLTEREWPVLVEHAYEEDRSLWLLLRDADPQEREFLLWWYAWHDPEFDQVVREHWASEAPDERWREERERLEDARSQLSYQRGGLIPAEPRPLAFLTSMFLHADLMHLVGNMIFLLLLGLPMEKRWRRGTLLLLYLVGGLGGGLAHMVAFPDSRIPTVGASGGVSALMGVYAATYGLRRVEFFYTLGFVFGSFRAPALWIFVVWMGWELLRHFSADSNVAFLAHAGGMGTGLVLAFLLRRYLPHQTTHMPDAGEDTTSSREPEPVPRDLVRLVEALEFETALQRVRQRLASRPGDEALWIFRMEVAGRRNNRELDATLADALRALHQGRIDDRLAGVLREEYRRYGGNDDRLVPALRLLLAELALRQGDEAEAARIVSEIRAVGRWTHPRLERLHRLLQGRT